jgi:hypothetical protein
VFGPGESLLPSSIVGHMNNFSKELAVTRAGYPFFPWIDIPNQITVPLYSKFSRVLSFWATFCFPRKYKGIGEGKKCINRKQKYGWGSPINSVQPTQF